jgi:hypothetical protein
LAPAADRAYGPATARQRAASTLPAIDPSHHPAKESLVSTSQAGSSGPPAFSAAGAVTAQPAPTSKVTLVIGYVCAVLFPLIGFVIGAVVAAKHRGGARNPGTGIMATAVAVFVLSMLVIAAAGAGGA